MNSATVSHLSRAIPVALFVAALGLRAQTAAPASNAASSPGAPIVALDAYQVTDVRPEPFSDRNVDAPRTVNDVQPYVIFNEKVIEESGAINMEDFLRNNLTMVNERGSNAQNTTSYGASSDISLRGFPTNQTLVLIDGRRLPNVFVAGSVYQPDLNGIPMGAIDRIEVLPASASGLYGGSAVAGVINVVLKKNYTGGEVRVSYDTPVNTDASIRTVNATYGRSFENGRSHFTITGQYSDAHALRLGDRKDIFLPRLQQVLRNAPDFYYNTTTNPFLGAGVNIASNGTANLALKPAFGGQTLPATYTNLPAGITPTSSASTIGAGLLANAGNFNMTPAYVNSNGPATDYIFGFTPVTKGFSASYDRHMFQNVDAFVDYNYSSNYATEDYNGQFTNSPLAIPAAAPTNPFTTAVVLKTPLVMTRQRHGTSITRTLATGFKVKLPKNWIAQFDYTWSQNAAGTFLWVVDSTALNADILSGAFNPFVDPLQYGPSLDKYAALQNFTFKETFNTLALRGSGQLPSLPWGTPTLNLRAERRFEGQKDGLLDRNYPLTLASSNLTTYLGLLRDVRSANAEMLVPLAPRHRFPLLYSLEGQVAGSREEFVVGTGTSTATFSRATNTLTYAAPNLNGQPLRKNVIFTSSNPTVGLKYQPIESFIIRGSTGMAFLPPTSAQMIRNPIPNTGTTTVLDPKTNTSYQVQTISGGNENVVPQRARTDTIGFIWQPRWGRQNLRLEADYTNIRQTDAIATLSAQQILNLESTNPDRVTRDSTGKVTLIDASSLNLYKRNFESWDLLLDYRINTAEAGTFTFKARETFVLHSKYQYSLTAPMYDVAGYPLESGAMKKRYNLGLAWEDVHWTATWNARYFDSYFEYGAAGGSLSVQNAGGADFSNYVRALGSRKVDSQMVHDLIVGYNFGRVASSGRKETTWLGNRMFDGLSVQVGIKNVFNKAPAFDTSPFAIGLMSSYGDPRMRDIWVSVKKMF